MSGFGRHTSKVIAYLRDQVEPPCRSLNSSLPYRCPRPRLANSEKL
ncbi:hypothetical protein ALC62_11749 [Cyphomyrmex costatus]|uniref:Uncharacterized protein n=1 Tax=Cyphomyrmex costatus TaxID=456900 RepID=A0A195C9F7_9HYME|nr:hypothetical protein ALC62_11749 [Cyphomyrmex costatus]